MIDLAKKREELARANENDRGAADSVLKRVTRKSMVADIDVGRSDCAKTNMNINYAIVQAREQLNEAIEKLLAKKDKSYGMLVEKLSGTTQEGREVRASGDKLKVATISLLGDPNGKT